MLEVQPTVVSLSDAAAAKLAELTKEETSPDIGLRVYVYSGGCSGYRYGMMLEDQPTAEDSVLAANGVRVYIDQNSIPLIQGSEIDYVDTLMGAGFTVNNPNAVSGCGCGSSFRTEGAAGAARSGAHCPPGASRARQPPDESRRTPGGSADSRIVVRWPQPRCRSRCSRSIPCSLRASRCRSTSSRSTTGRW